MDLLLPSTLPLSRAIKTTRSPFILNSIGDPVEKNVLSLPLLQLLFGVWVCRVSLPPLVPTHSSHPPPSRGAGSSLLPPGLEVEEAEPASPFLSEIAQSFVAIY